MSENYISKVCKSCLRQFMGDSEDIDICEVCNKVTPKGSVKESGKSGRIKKSS